MLCIRARGSERDGDDAIKAADFRDGLAARMSGSHVDFSRAQPDILVLIGTVTGNAEAVADGMAARLSNHGFTVHLVDMMDALPETLAEFSQVIVCTSSWGDGDVPDNAIDLFDGLNSVGPDLSHIQYGVIGLGDRVYEPHFCGGAVKFEALLASLGARRVVSRHEIDAGPSNRDIEEAALWAERCAAAFAPSSLRVQTAA